MAKWISVKDRLPKESGSYLVSLHQEDDELGKSSDCVLFAWYQPYNLLFFNKDIGWSLLNEFYDLSDRLRPCITHWMPLPEPPKEGE